MKVKVFFQKPVDKFFGITSSVTMDQEDAKIFAEQMKATGYEVRILEREAKP